MTLQKRLKFTDIVKRQLSFKLRTYHHLIGTLWMFQVVALFFSIYGQSSTVTDHHLTITNHMYSADIIVGFTLLWIFTVPFYMTSRASKQMMFRFVTNKLSNHVANFLYMMILSVLGTFSAVLLGVVVRLAMLMYNGFDHLFTYEFLSVSQLLWTMLVVFLYHLLLFSIGYVLGEMIQLHRSLLVLVPLVLLGLVVLSVNVFEGLPFVTFYTTEAHLGVFFVKVFATIVVCWGIALQVGKRLEVHRS